MAESCNIKFEIVRMMEHNEPRALKGKGYVVNKLSIVNNEMTLCLSTIRVLSRVMIEERKDVIKRQMICKYQNIMV